MSYDISSSLVNWQQAGTVCRGTGDEGAAHVLAMVQTMTLAFADGGPFAERFTPEDQVRFAEGVVASADLLTVLGAMVREHNPAAAEYICRYSISLGITGTHLWVDAP